MPLALWNPGHDGCRLSGMDAAPIWTSLRVRDWLVETAVVQVEVLGQPRRNDPH